MTTLALILIATLQTTAEKPVADTTTRSQSVELSEVNETFMDDARVDRAFENELNKPAYKRLRTKLKRFETGELPKITAPSWWTRFWRWVASWFTWKPGTPGGGAAGGAGWAFGGVSGGTVIVWVLVAILLAVIVAFIIKSASVRIADEKERKRVTSDLDTDSIQPSTPPGEIPSDEYMHRAMELAREGDNRRALRQLVLGGMSWIERAGLIRFRKGLTNRDYVRAVYRREQQRKRFAGIILNFERVYFGRREASDEQFQKCLAEYQNAFGNMLDAETALKQQQDLIAKQTAAESATEKSATTKSATAESTIAASQRPAADQVQPDAETES